MPDRAPFDVSQLDALRRSAGLAVHTEGHLLHEGDRFVHARLEALLLSGLDLHPQSREPILRVGQQWCYVQYDATPFVVQAVKLRADGLWLRLNTGLETTMGQDGPSLWLEGDHRLWLQLADPDGQPRWARCNRAVWQKLSARIEADASDGLWLRGDGWTRPIHLSAQPPVSPVQA